DSGLEIDALHGRPGIFSARYAGEPTDDGANNRKVLSELKDVPGEDRTARLVCVIAIAAPGKKTIFRTGHCEGKIASEPRGGIGFGYDPIFVTNGYSVTMAALPAEGRTPSRHRSKTIQQ